MTKADVLLTMGWNQDQIDAFLTSVLTDDVHVLSWLHRFRPDLRITIQRRLIELNLSFNGWDSLIDPLYAEADPILHEVVINQLLTRAAAFTEWLTLAAYCCDRAEYRQFIITKMAENAQTLDDWLWVCVYSDDDSFVQRVKDLAQTTSDYERILSLIAEHDWDQLDGLRIFALNRLGRPHTLKSTDQTMADDDLPDESPLLNILREHTRALGRRVYTHAQDDFYQLVEWGIQAIDPANPSDVRMRAWTLIGESAFSFATYRRFVRLLERAANDGERELTVEEWTRALPSLPIKLAHTAATVKQCQFAHIYVGLWGDGGINSLLRRKMVALANTFEDWLIVWQSYRDLDLDTANLALNKLLSFATA